MHHPIDACLKYILDDFNDIKHMSVLALWLIRMTMVQDTDRNKKRNKHGYFYKPISLAEEKDGWKLATEVVENRRNIEL